MFIKIIFHTSLDIHRISANEMFSITSRVYTWILRTTSLIQVFMEGVRTKGN